ncbi:MAG: hypothetical protein CMO61_11105 [Verrucomicrobiales bacterium]|jgi:hypothetical protein|nr:hypothetical protein [Verrucomicrobiales bacterium]|tara:strand:- start:1979 stop:2233 length:255 start_codon:yes stop_codon:yes gene_type:complete
MDVPKKITCVDCGQPAYRLTYPPEDGWVVGDYVAYRCSGCNDRWDLIVNEEDAAEQPPSSLSIADEARAILQSRIDQQRPNDSN